MKMILKILYDNYAVDNFKAGWGFSCLIESNENKILFDTGWNGNILLSNMKLMGINPAEINKIVISHSHWDHIGGLNHLLKYGANPIVYLPQSLSTNLKNEIKRHSNVIEVSSQRKISDNIWTTGELGEDIKEQSLVIKTEEGNILITGCAHPGLDNIIKNSENLGTIHAIMGGFHDSDVDVLKNIPITIPCHCTKKTEQIKKQMLESFRECKAGSVFKF
jgi:7,8-dihydropterin-6-yl-methyl-4-(beta-D-ribofuranosyl)aminobenzene 5'-phosphate synthase